MRKSKDTPTAAVDALAPYVKRAMQDPELREDLAAAFVTARSLYEKIGKDSGVKAKAKRVSNKDFQEDIQGLVTELTTASERLQGKEPKTSHKTRNRVVLLTGMTLGVLYNPWTGPATREWIMAQVAGGNGDAFRGVHERRGGRCPGAGRHGRGQGRGRHGRGRGRVEEGLAPTGACAPSACSRAPGTSPLNDAMSSAWRSTAPGGGSAGIPGPGPSGT